jgi:hypothetical protein
VDPTRFGRCESVFGPLADLLALVLSECGQHVHHELVGMRIVRRDEIDSVKWARQAVQLRPGILGGHRILCAGLAQAGLIEEAKLAMSHLRQLHPTLSIAWIKQSVPYTREHLQASTYSARIRAATRPSSNIGGGKGPPVQARPF